MNHWDFIWESAYDWCSEHGLTADVSDVFSRARCVRETMAHFGNIRLVLAEDKADDRAEGYR